MTALTVSTQYCMEIRDLDCACGCNGWWDLCVDNVDNRESFKLSPCPSPNRLDDDWFTQHNNPICVGHSTMSIVPNIPPKQGIHRISAKYISGCVDKYFDK